MNIDRFADALDSGVEEGVLPDEADRHVAEIRTARTWLFLLGYLTRNSESGSPGNRFRKALAALRADTGIESRTVELDLDTLAVLKRLLCFDSAVAIEDSNLRVDQRFTGLPLDSAVMLRAISLRLYALDLIETLPGTNPDRAKMEAGLAKFAKVYSLLGMDRVSATAEPATISALFDLEPLLLQLRNNEQATAIWHPQGSDPPEKRGNRELVKKFVNAVARIELWLIGYLARPRDSMWPRDNSNRSLPSALRAFWRDQPEAVCPPKAALDQLDGRFFKRVQAVIEHADRDDRLEREELQAELLKNPVLAETVRKESKSLGARLLDGAKRAARFIFGWIRMGLRKLVALARNMASLITRRVRKIFGAVSDIVFALGTSWRFLVRDPVPGSNAAHLLVTHDKDFDFLLLRNPAASPDQVRKIGRGLELTTRLMSATWRFVGRLIDAFMALAKRSGLGGWFGALLVLLEVRDWISEVRETIAIIASTRAELAALELES